MTSIDVPPPSSPRSGRLSSVGVTLAVLAPALAAGVMAIGVEVATAPAAHASPAGCVDSGLATRCTFGFTAATAEWTVPAGVAKATFTVVGAAGGNAGWRPGGAGGGVISTLPVTTGTVYRLAVGGMGANDTDQSPGRGGWNGGGHGAGILHQRGAGGGGASDVRVSPYGSSHRILVGGGGGGAGSPVKGLGPYGVPGAGGQGGGGSTFADGTPGGTVANAWVGAGGGGAGTSTSPGARGGASGGQLWGLCDSFGAAAVEGGPGGGGRGGDGGYLRHAINGERCNEAAGWGGGGGGGWYGGGGGGGGITGGGGGGGGSAYAPPGSRNTPWGAHTHGTITIDYLRASDDWVGLGGSAMTSAPTVATKPNQGTLAPRHDLFYLDQHGAVIWRSVIDGVPGPETNLGATLYPGSTVAAIWRPYGLELFGRGTENALWRKTLTFGTWSAWTPLTSAGALTSDPTVAAQDLERLDVFFRGTDNRLRQLTSTNGTWAAAPVPVPGGPTISTGPGATYTEPGRIDLLAGCETRLCWWTSINGTWTHQGTIPGSLASSTPSVTTPVEGWITATVRNPDAGITRWAYTGGGDWFPTTTMTAPSDPHQAHPDQANPDQAVAVVPAYRMELIYARGADNQLNVRTRTW